MDEKILRKSMFLTDKIVLFCVGGLFYPIILQIILYKFLNVPREASKISTKPKAKAGITNQKRMEHGANHRQLSGVKNFGQNGPTGHLVSIPV